MREDCCVFVTINILLNRTARRVDGSMEKYGAITDLVSSYKHFSPECHQVATADWHRCSLNRYLLSCLVNACYFRSLCLKLLTVRWSHVHGVYRQFTWMMEY